MEPLFYNHHNNQGKSVLKRGTLTTLRIKHSGLKRGDPCSGVLLQENVRGHVSEKVLIKEGWFLFWDSFTWKCERKVSEKVV